MTIDPARLASLLATSSLRPLKATALNSGGASIASERDGESVAIVERLHDAALFVEAVNALPALLAVYNAALAWRDTERTGGTSTDTYNAKMRLFDLLGDALGPYEAALLAAIDATRSRP